MKQRRYDRIFPMKRLIPAFAIILGWASAAWAAEPATLTTLSAIHALTNAEASQALPVAFEATVTYVRGYENDMFVQDGDFAVFVIPTADAKLVPGDRILVRGTTQPSFRTNVLSNKITLLRHGAPPRPVPAIFDDLIRARYDCRLVTVHAVIRAADSVVSGTVPPVRSAILQRSEEHTSELQ